MKRLLVGGAALAFALALGAALLELPPAAIDLRPTVTANLASSGVEHPVTAVLLNFRGYDTLLEVAVLLLALFALLAQGLERQPARLAPPSLPLAMLARIASPPLLLVAAYLLWAGAFRPGGAFQAGAVLAAGAVLLHLTGVLPGWLQPRARLRWGLAGGFLAFLGVAAAMLAHGALLEYPPALAGALILLIETGLTLSLGLILAGLFLFMSCDEDGER
ncbi:Na(+)/H(+) antiporter subunit B [Pseudomonas stutzeri]|nr:Na(+)/H(+) antiporter subunit B [Stutzerimonas stutzeri]